MLPQFSRQGLHNEIGFRASAVRFFISLWQIEWNHWWGNTERCLQRTVIHLWVIVAHPCSKRFLINLRFQLVGSCVCFYMSGLFPLLFVSTLSHEPSTNFFMII